MDAKRRVLPLFSRTLFHIMFDQYTCSKLEKQIRNNSVQKYVEALLFPIYLHTSSLLCKIQTRLSLTPLKRLLFNLLHF